MLRLFLLLLIPIVTNAQEVIFCESVERSGMPVKESKEFSIGNNGGFVKILVKLKKEIGSENVVFDIYKIKDSVEVFNNTIRMSTQPALTWFYKEITFFKEGDYRVYVYDDSDKLLGVGEVKINLR
jgi:hypothetical protein